MRLHLRVTTLLNKAEANRLQLRSMGQRRIASQPAALQIQIRPPMMMVVLVVIGGRAHHVRIARSTAKDIPAKKHFRAPSQYRIPAKTGSQPRSIVLGGHSTRRSSRQNRHRLLARNRRSTGRRPKILSGCQESGLTCKMKGINRHAKGLATRRRRVIRQGIRRRSQINRKPMQIRSGGHQVTCEGA